MTTENPPLPVQQEDQFAAGTGHGEFFLDKDGERLARMVYRREDDTVTIQHTEVSDVLRGQGAGKRLLDDLVRWARQDHLQVVPRCPYARATFAKHPDLRDVLAPDFQL